jgi:hypothetical protein
VSVQLILDSLSSQLLSLGFENVFLQDALALEHVTLGLEVQLVVPRSQRKVTTTIK